MSYYETGFEDALELTKTYTLFYGSLESFDTSEINKKRNKL